MLISQFKPTLGLSSGNQVRAAETHSEGNGQQERPQYVEKLKLVRGEVEMTPSSWDDNLAILPGGHGVDVVLAHHQLILSF